MAEDQKKFAASISEAINQNLPAAVASELQIHLENAENDRKQLLVVKSQLSEVKGQLATTEKYRSDLQAQNKVLEAQLATYKDREQEFKNSEITVIHAKHEALTAKAVQVAVQQVVDTVFRNGMVKRSIFESNQEPIMNPQGYQQGTANSSSSKTITEENVG